MSGENAPSPRDPMWVRKHAIFLPDGQRFGDIMTDWQEEDFVAGDEHPDRHTYWERPRAHSKTWDLAVNAATDMLLGPPRRNLYGLAADEEQGELLKNDIAGIFDRHPTLRPLVKIAARTITVQRSGTTFTNLNSNAPTLYGLRPDRVYVDELVEHRRRDAWDALWTATGKRPGCTVHVISTAGWDRTHFAWAVREHARTDPAWLFSSRGQCAAWITPAWLAQQRATLPEHVYARLHECRWVEGAGAWLSVAQVDGVFGGVPEGDGEDSLGLDIGIARDRTVIARVTRLDGLYAVRHLQVFAPSKEERVDLTLVEAELEALARRHRCPVYYDPHQAESMAQRLTQRGISMHAVPFTNEKRRTLFSRLLDLIRTGRLRAHPHELLREELLGLEVKETLAGWRVDHKAGRHDDCVVAVGLALSGLAEADIELAFVGAAVPRSASELEAEAAQEYAEATQRAQEAVTSAIQRSGVFWPGEESGRFWSRR